jgi:small subunit ribosomal protein S20
MAHHKSALKRIRQSDKKRIYNRQNKKSIKLSVRAINEADNFETAQQKLSEAFKVLDKAAARGILHKNTAANKKARLTKRVNKLKAE